MSELGRRRAVAFANGATIAQIAREEGVRYGSVRESVERFVRQWVWELPETSEVPGLTRFERWDSSEPRPVWATRRGTSRTYLDGPTTRELVALALGAPRCPHCGKPL